MSLTFLSLNIEADRHLAEVGEYLRVHSPDVVHLQEVYKIHAEQWAREFGYHLTFAPHADYQVTEHIFKPLGLWGIATLTKVKPESATYHYYSTPPHNLPTDYHTLKEGHPRAVIITRLRAGGYDYTFANTHFTWAMPDSADTQQAPDLARFLSIIKPFGSLIISGDFNAPRQSRTYLELSKIYRSAVPLSVDSTLDPLYFRKPELKLVVDHLFSTPDYMISNVQVLTGLSDHCAISAVITKNS